MVRISGRVAPFGAILLVTASAPAGAQVVPGYQPRFEPAACPSEPPAPALPTACCGFLVVPVKGRLTDSKVGWRPTTRGGRER
jgi:hypothetical protein